MKVERVKYPHETACHGHVGRARARRQGTSAGRRARRQGVGVQKNPPHPFGHGGEFLLKLNAYGVREMRENRRMCCGVRNDAIGSNDDDIGVGRVEIEIEHCVCPLS